MIALLAIASAIAAGQDGAAPKRLDCRLGPIHRTFAKGSWLVYGCNDGASLVVVADQGNPAAVFYFVVTPKGDGFSISGEGTGDRADTSEAFDELQRLSAEQIREMYRQAGEIEPTKP